MQGYGIDIGGSGIKGAPVDLGKGAFTAERIRIETPTSSTPEAVADIVADIVGQHGWSGPLGCTFPAVVQHGVVRTAANVDKGWIGTDLAALMSEKLGQQVIGVNDADAAGLAEVRYGAAKGHDGIVLMITLGTGIGTALIYNGTLVPNSELGHLEVKGRDAETRASDAARERDDLSWDKWAKRLGQYLRHLEDLLWPDLIVVGGGVSKKAAKFLPQVELRTKIVPAELLNEAGIVGAALLASESAAGTSAGRRSSPTRQRKTAAAKPAAAKATAAGTKTAARSTSARTSSRRTRAASIGTPATRRRTAG